MHDHMEKAVTAELGRAHKERIRRDIATAALRGILSKPSAYSYQQTAQAAVKYADALIWELDHGSE